MKYSRYFIIQALVLCVVNNLSANFEHTKVVNSELKPFLEGIHRAEEFLYLGAYKLNDYYIPNTLLDISGALKKASQKHSMWEPIRVIVEKNITPEEHGTAIKPRDAQKTFDSMGAQLYPGSSNYNATHCKVLITGPFAFVGTTNFDKERSFDESGWITRDFSLILRDPQLIQELKTVFLADMEQRKPELLAYNVIDLKEGDTALTWGPEQHRQHLEQLIANATKTIEIYQQDLQDEKIVQLLVDAIKRGVNVAVLMSEFPFGPKHGNKNEKNQRMIMTAKSDNGQAIGQVKLTGKLIQGGALDGKRLHIHAKVMIIDGNKMYLGSSNFYTPSLDEDRNVGVITLEPDYIKPVREQFMADWKAH